MLYSFTSILLSVTLFSLKSAIGSDVKISDENDFTAFLKCVNNGTSYSGTTVFLNSDIALSENVEPIGTDSSHYFRGTFDGQGYTINNLTILSSSTKYTGLFGYSDGQTVKNVILDSSCSITSSTTNSNDEHIGGIIGYCRSYSSQCNIENSVNMASITFSGSIDIYDLYLGGIAGYINSYSSSNNINIKNCANYGSVTHSGTVGFCSYTGGIVGYIHGSYNKYIYNCLNYGTITHSGSSCYHLGGIIGYSKYTYVENCVSAGRIASSSDSSYVGSIVGYIDSSTYIDYCYYTSGLSDFNVYGSGNPASVSNTVSYSTSTFKLGQTVSIGNYSRNSLIEALNAAVDHYTLRDYSHWLLNKGESIATFTINSRSNPTKLSHQVLLLPSLAREGKLWFDGWYINSGCSLPLTSYTIDSPSNYYGKFENNNNRYTITFDTRGGTPTPESITSQYLSSVDLPTTPTKDGRTIAFWETEYGDKVEKNFVMPAHNIVLYAVYLYTHITSAAEFNEFSKIVNRGLNYEKTTVYLDSDVDFSGEFSQLFEPIGKDHINYFLGTFDGQGHTISNLKIMSSSAQYTGLFGYSDGQTVKNIILDSSCSITSSTTNSNNDAYIGGIIGYCQTRFGSCFIENSVNMASITFSGSIGIYDLYLGGIAGYINSYSSSYNINIKNCANYGYVTHSGTVGFSSYIGGIVGYIYGSYNKYIYNCLNYGTITHSGSSNNLYLGSIIGYSKYTYVENCVSAGRIAASSDSSYVGSIVGYIDSSTTITHSFWTSNVGYSAVSGSGSPTIDTESSLVSLDSDFADKVSAYSTTKSWNKWLLNTNSVLISFTVNYGKEFGISSQIMLLPNPVDNSKRSFSGWYSDKNMTSPLTGNVVEYSTTLYGIFCGSSYTVSFDVNGGDISSLSAKSMTFKCNGTYGILPIPTRTEASFTGWYTESINGDKIESGDRVTNLNDHTLYAHWVINKYTLTFDFNNGINTKVIVLEYNSPIVYPDIPEREGYTSNGWDNSIENMPARDFTITAQWTVNQYTLTFIFNNGTNPEVRILDFDENITYPDDPLKEGYTFSGWNKLVSNMPSRNLNITAQWNINQYVLTFIFDNGLEPEEVILYYNENITYPDDPVKEGYTFGGWDSSIENMPARNLIITAQWIINQYTLMFIFNNGTDPEVRILDFDENITYPDDPVKEGYTFSEWNKLISNMPSRNLNITAQWNINQYILTFVFGNGVDPEIRVLNFNSDIIYPNDPVKEGYTFNEWDKTITSMPSRNVNITAQWIANTYTVTFDPNGGSELSVKEKSVTFDSTYGALPTPTREGYTFGGWFTANNVVVTDKTVVKISNNHTLYAHWVIIGYSVKFVFNNGDEPEVRVFDYNEVITRPNDPVKEGYTFSGWDNSVEYMPAYNLTITAQWTINNYTLTFIFGNGVDPEVRILDFNENITYPSDPVKEGYTFNGWNSIIKYMPARDLTITAQWNINNYTLTFIFGNGVDPEVRILDFDENIIYPNDPVKEGYTFSGWDKSITSMPSRNLDITAQWVANNYTVTFNPNGGDELSVNEKSVTFDSTYGTLPTPTREGYTFGGWFNSNNVVVTDKTVVKISKDHVIYANWTINKYTLTFIFGNGAYPEVKTLCFDENITYPGDPVKEGYTFSGWDNNIINMPAHNLTITAQWTINNYTLTFIFGNGVDPEVRILDYNSNIEYPQNIKKDGYTFNGWDNNIKLMPSRNLNITAQWNINNYTLTFVFDNGVDPEVRVLNFNSAVIYPNDPVRDGYAFSGWDNNIKVMPSRNLNITALWIANTYTVTFDPNGGSELSVKEKSVTFDSTYGALPTTTREGHTFDGWFTTDNVVVTDKTVVKISNNHALYAHWVINKYMLTFIFNNGTEPEVRAIDFDSVIEYPQNVQKEGYSFTKWDDNTTHMPSRNLTITAQWTINKYMLVFVFGNGDESETRILEFNASIIYPGNITREGYKFNGWDNNIKYMPARDLTITAVWSDPRSKMMIYIIVGISVPACIIVAAVVIFILFVVLKKKGKDNHVGDNVDKYELDEPLIGKNNEPNYDGYYRVVAMTDDEVDSVDAAGVTNVILSTLYPKVYLRPTMRDALLEAEIPKKKVDLICEACENSAQIVAKEGDFPEWFAEDDAAAIAMYTYDFGSKDLESNPYRIINKSLVGRNYAALQKASGLLYLVLTAVRKLPRSMMKTLYRGVRGRVNLDENHYHKGNIITWSALSSTSPNMDATKAFLARGTKDNKAVGTLFIIEGGWGYNIQPYSLFTNEEEILLEPERKFKVKSVIRGEGLTFINIQMLNTPIILPHVFGYEDNTEKCFQQT